MALLGPSLKYTPRSLFVQTRLQDGELSNELFMTVTTDQGTNNESLSVTDQVQRHRVSLEKQGGAEWIQVSFSAAASPTHSAIDVERVVLGAFVEPRL